MINEQVLYKGENYHLYLSEQEHITHPMEFGIHSVWPSTDTLEYQNTYQIDDRNLVLKNTFIRTNSNNVSFVELNSITPMMLEEENVRIASYENINIPLKYSGGMIILKDFIDKYGFESEYPCYCFKNVVELIFNEGCLITSVDHSRAMLKIRKNIDAGLRNPRVKKDIKCIESFIKSSFIGEYKRKKKRPKRKKSLVYKLRKKKKIS